MNRKSMILGTRGSALALAQTQIVRALLHRSFPSLEIEIKIIKTTGDKKMGVSLAKSGVKGLFTKELEEALVRRKIDIAIHSLKDLPTRLPVGLALGAVTEREDVADVLIGHPSSNLDQPEIVFSSSPRRAIQAKLLWPKCVTKEIRGNVETRLQKIADGDPNSALLLAAAGLKRLDYLKDESARGTLKWDPPLPFRKLSLQEMIPAPGQGGIGIEIRRDDGEIQEKLKSVNHPPTWAAVTAERTFLDAVGGGCSAPVAAYASVGIDGLKLTAIAAFEGQQVWRGEKSGTRRDAESIGKALAEELKLSTAKV